MIKHYTDNTRSLFAKISHCGPSMRIGLLANCCISFKSQFLTSALSVLPSHHCLSVPPSHFFSIVTVPQILSTSQCFTFSALPLCLTFSTLSQCFAVSALSKCLVFSVSDSVSASLSVSHRFCLTFSVSISLSH